MTIRRTITTALLATAAAAILAGCGTHPGSTTTAPTSAAKATVTVAYIITGTAKKVDLTLQTATGQSQQNNLPVPVKNKAGTDINFEATPGQFVYVSAQNQGSYGSVTCEITSGGVSVSQNTSTGGYSIATCSGKA
jgi:ABC-type glycerol-3-phosphate transport system substrate-binding protein